MRGRHQTVLAHDTPHLADQLDERGNQDHLHVVDMIGPGEQLQFKVDGLNRKVLPGEALAATVGSDENPLPAS